MTFFSRVQIQQLVNGNAGERGMCEGVGLQKGHRSLAWESTFLICQELPIIMNYTTWVVVLNICECSILFGGD